MNSFREYVELRYDTLEGARMCFVHNGKIDRAFVCDMSVYSRNRNFRMPYCTKRGKNAPLIPISAPGGSEFDAKLFFGERKKEREKREESLKFFFFLCVFWLRGSGLSCSGTERYHGDC